MAYNTLPYRPHVSSTSNVLELIARGTCWHFDAWMFRDIEHDAFYLRTETRAGGRELIASNTYRLALGDAPRLEYAYITEGSARLSPITLQDRDILPHYSGLNAVHWRYVVPMSCRVPAGFRSRSVCMHYVRAPSIEPVAADVLNSFTYGGG